MWTALGNRVVSAPRRAGRKGRGESGALARAEAFLAAGDIGRAEAICADLLARHPASVPALKTAARAAAAHGRPATACDLLARALAVDPDDPDLLHESGLAQRAAGRPAAAVAAFRLALDRGPSDRPLTLTCLGNVLKALGRWEEAVAAHCEALSLRPSDATVWANLGATKSACGDAAAAVECHEQAVALRPDVADLHCNLGNALLATDRADAAVASYRVALSLAPGHRRARIHLGVALREAGDIEGAIATLREAVRRAPEDADAHWNLALALLAAGRFKEGWAEYEWRARLPGFAMKHPPGPCWDGSPLDGRTILLHAEQGLGDTIQFLRYLPFVCAAGGTVLLCCQAPLRPLLEQMPGVGALLRPDQPTPAYDVHAPLASLPHLLGGELPAPVSYLRAEAGRVQRWRQRLDALPGMRVGVAWQGNPRYRADRRRSIPLAAFLPLMRRPGITLVSLQKGVGTEQLGGLPDDAGIVDFGEELDRDGAFLDTAALIGGLDLVISSDTAVPHLAGALGAPVWLALGDAPDWRWSRSGETTPWYPTMRLHRRRRDEDWPALFERIAGMLDGHPRRAR